MQLDSVLLPDHYNGGNQSNWFIHYFTSDQVIIRNNIILKQNLICILLDGTKEVFGSHERIKIDNREMLLMRKGTTIMVHSAAAESGKLASLLLFFSDEVLREFALKHNLIFSGKDDVTPPTLRIAKDDFLRSYERSLELLAQGGLGSLQRLKLEELLVYLTMQKKSPDVRAFIRNATGRKSNGILQHVVGANCHNGLTIEELAFLCDMSVSSFKRHFVRIFKCSPKKYLIQKKMERACELLQLNHKASEIYPQLRYQSLSSFSTEFKKHIGVSPKQFQEEFQVAQGELS